MSGVKGMRWGVRKTRKYPVGPVKTNPHSGASGTLKVAGPVGPGTGHRAYDITKLDNASLAKVVNRMALEKRYNELNRRPSDVSVNSVLNKKFMLDIMKQSLSAAAASTSKHFVDQALNKHFPDPTKQKKGNNDKNNK